MIYLIGMLFTGGYIIALEKEGGDLKKAAKEIVDGKSLKEAGLKPVFRLNPARGGFKSIKAHYPKGALGKWENIDSLIEKMM